MSRTPPPPDARAPSPARRRHLMHLLGLGALAGSALPGCASRATTTAPSNEPLRPREQVAPFSLSPPGTTLPSGWRPYVMRPDRPQTQYRIVPHDGRPVLHARADSAASGLRCEVDVDPLRQPRLHFSWRVDHAPRHASVEEPESDDCPARVIVAFDGDVTRLPLRDRLLYEQVELFTGHRLPFATLMYVWDGMLAPDSVMHNHRTRRIQYLAVESGDARVGRWLHYERDVVADYHRVFGETPGRVTSVGVLTDSDALKLPIEAWYGDIRFAAA